MKLNKKLMQKARQNPDAVRTAKLARAYDPSISNGAMKKYIRSGGHDTTDTREIDCALWNHKTQQALQAGKIRAYKLQPSTPEILAEEQRLAEENPLKNQEEQARQSRIKKWKKRGVVAIAAGMLLALTNTGVQNYLTHGRSSEIAAAGFPTWKFFIGNHNRCNDYYFSTHCSVFGKTFETRLSNYPDPFTKSQRTTLDVLAGGYDSNGNLIDGRYKAIEVDLRTGKCADFKDIIGY